MLIKVGNFEYSEVWNNTFYKKLSKYPHINDWEIRNIIEFIDYETNHGRKCEIECEDKELLDKISMSISEKDKYMNIQRPALITECTTCPYRKGCLTEYVCHTTSVESVVQILKSGKLLSAVKARKLPAEQLVKEKRNAANDPADYFEYIMFSWGNCQAGDRLVMERRLGRFPNEKDLSTDFTPGVRFYFKYDDLIKHHNVIFDGVLPLKVKDEIVLSDWVHAIVIPSEHKKQIENVIPDNLKNKTIYVENDCMDIWEWSEKVYSVVERRDSIPMERTEAMYE